MNEKKFIIAKINAKMADYTAYICKICINKEYIFKTLYLCILYNGYSDSE